MKDKNMSDEESAAELKPLKNRKLSSSTSLDLSHKALKLESVPQRSWIVRRIYFLTWIRNYTQDLAISDSIAGTTLGLTIIPQSLAYAALAGLPSSYGLYSSFIGALIYVFFGTVKEVSIGPTSLMSLLTLQYTYEKPPGFAIMLAFLAGFVELLMGFLKLGFIVDFISAPVVSAFTSATSIIIIGSQIKNLLGIKYAAKGFADSVIEVFGRIDETRLGDGLLGLFCIIFLFGLRQINTIPIKTDTKRGQIIKKVLWYISISRNALCVMISSIFAYNWVVPEGEKPPFYLSADVEPGIPSFVTPPFTITEGNQTYSFLDICGELGSGIIVVPLVAVLANVAIAKSFTTDTLVDATQEMITLGLCNLVGSCFQAIPTCGAFTRSAVSQASGVKTPFSGIYSAILVLLALSLLTPYFKFIPQTTLAAVLMCAVIVMVDFKIAVRLWKESKRDLIGWIGCFVSSLWFGVEIGLLIGIIINTFNMIMKFARPDTIVKMEEVNHMNYICIKPAAGIFFPGIDFLREKVNMAALASDYQVPIAIDCSKISGMDFTSARGIDTLALQLDKHNVLLILENLDVKLEKFIDTSKPIIICNNEKKLEEILIQENIRNGHILLKDHIKESVNFDHTHHLKQPDTKGTNNGSVKNLDEAIL